MYASFRRWLSHTNTDSERTGLFNGTKYIENILMFNICKVANVNFLDYVYLFTSMPVKECGNLCHDSQVYKNVSKLGSENGD